MIIYLFICLINPYIIEKKKQIDAFSHKVGNGKLY